MRHYFLPRPVPARAVCVAAPATQTLRVSLRGGTRRMRLIPTRANGQPAFGCYVRDSAAPVARAYGLLVLTLDGDRVCAVTRFIDNRVLPRFGLPRTLPDEEGQSRNAVKP